MDYLNSDKLLFICASPAASGYRLGRIVSCIDNVYWYRNKRNGDVPYNTFYSEDVKGKSISQYHYDRRTKTNMIPLVGERIEKYWKNEDINYYYSTVWTRMMDVSGAKEIIDQGKFISWIIHDNPKSILNRFPNCKVINLIDDDIGSVATRYLETTALFPAKLENKNIKPTYYNEYAESLINLQKLNADPTYRDLWAWEKYKIEKYHDSLANEYYRQIFNELTVLNSLKKIIDPKCLTVSWSTFRIEEVLKFLNSKDIDINYKILL
jgi:hypothetical protein